MITIGIFLFDNMEVLDFGGPFEVFSTAQRLQAIKIDDPTDRLFNVITIAEQKKKITCRGGLQVLPTHGIEYHPHLDVLIIPGGVVTAEMKKQNVISWITSLSEWTDISATVGTGVFLIAQAGLLNNEKVTTHGEYIDALRDSFPGLDVQENIGWTDSGWILTSAGISAGIDMGLHIVGRLAGKELAVNTARQMEYRWQDE